MPGPSRKLLDAVGVVLWEARVPNLRRSFVSQHAERLFGYPVGRWIKEPRFWLEHVHPDDRKRVLASVRAYLASRSAETFVLSYRFLAADGGVIWIRDTMRMIPPTGSAPRLSGVMSDVSDMRRRSARQPLRVSRRLVRLPLGRRLRSKRRMRARVASAAAR